MRYWLHGRQEKVTIGTYPATSLKKARQTRREYRRMIDEGRSPMRERQTKKTAHRTAGIPALDSSRVAP